MKLLKIFLIIIIFLAGILVGFYLKNFPNITWNHEVKIYEVFQVLSTLFIGIGIPFLIKKWIDDSRNIKSLLVDEGKDIIIESKKIKDAIFKYFEQGSISEKEKQLLLSLFTQLENSIARFKISLETSFGMKCNSEYQSFKIAYYEYWNNVTGGELMSSTVTEINSDFLDFHTAEYNTFQNSLRVFLIALQKI
jgi:hypothetical protein